MSIVTLADLNTAPRTAIPIYLNDGQFSSTQTVSWRGRLFLAPTWPIKGTIATPTDKASGGQLYSNGDLGFIPFPAVNSYLVGANASQNQNNWAPAALYDFVWGCSGFVGNTGSAQNVSSFPTLTRPGSTGEGLELFLYAASASSGTSVGITVAYTDSNNVSQSATLYYGNTTLLNGTSWLLPFKLANGGKGVKSIQSLTMGSALAVAGSFWLFLARPIAFFDLGNSQRANADNDFLRLGMPLIASDAALMLISPPTPSTNVVGIVELVLAHG